MYVTVFTHASIKKEHKFYDILSQNRNNFFLVTILDPFKIIFNPFSIYPNLKNSVLKRHNRQGKSQKV